MNQPIPPRDHGLLGMDARRAVDTGLATAERHRTDLPRRQMKAFIGDRAPVRVALGGTNGEGD